MWWWYLIWCYLLYRNKSLWFKYNKLGIKSLIVPFFWCVMVLYKLKCHALMKSLFHTVEIGHIQLNHIVLLHAFTNYGVSCCRHQHTKKNVMHSSYRIYFQINAFLPWLNKKCFPLCNLETNLSSSYILYVLLSVWTPNCQKTNVIDLMPARSASVQRLPALSWGSC